jgi:prepilin-type processing-associated H-X9-DG protein
MSREAVERLADRLLAAAQVSPAREASAANLRRLGEAIQAHLKKTGRFPQTWADLVKEGLLGEPEGRMHLFENPALATHLPTGDYELLPLPKEASAEPRAFATLQAYEVYPKDTPPAGLNVLFADGHVEYMEYGKFQQLYRQTLTTLGR